MFMNRPQYRFILTPFPDSKNLKEHLQSEISLSLTKISPIQSLVDTL